MARQTSIPAFRLEPDPTNPSRTSTNTSTSSQAKLATVTPVPPVLQTPRSQIRVRRSACSDLQSTAIPEERVYNGNRRRASLFVDRPAASPQTNLSRLATCDREPSERDYAKLCREKCRSLYGSLADPKAVSTSSSDSVPFLSNSYTISDDDLDDDEDDVDDDDERQDEDETRFETTSKTTFRHSLPDTSPAGLALKNFLRRRKTSNCPHHHHHHLLGLPSHSSQSLCSSPSSSSTSILNNSLSALSTFRNFLSLVKLPTSSTTKSINTSTPSSVHHSSLTTLTSASNSGLSSTLDQTTTTPISSKKRPTTTIDTQYQWHYQNDTCRWCSSDGTSCITLGAIELHNLTTVEHKHLKRLVLQRLQSNQYDLGVQIHIPKEETVRKRKHHFMFRSKSSDKSKEAREAKANGNVFGVALAQCVLDDDSHFQDETNLMSPTSATTPTASASASASASSASAAVTPVAATGTNRKDSADFVSVVVNDKRTSPSGSISSTNDSGYSISPASPSSLHIFDSDYEQSKHRSVSLEALEGNESTAGINRCNTIRCYPAKVPELIQNCCDYLEKNALQTVGLFRIGVSKKRLKELKEQVNLNRSLTFDSSTNVHDIAGLIKEFLRELPEPLLTRDLCTAFLNIRSKLNPKDQSRALSYLIALLPSSNRDTLYTLLKFLYRVSLNAPDRCATDGKVLAAGNKMDAANLAIVFAPTILMDSKAPVISNKGMNVAISTDQMEQGKSVLKMMIEQYKELFMVPKDLHNQICLALHESDSTQLMRALAFKVQKGCGISSMQLDETNEHRLMSLDLSPLLCETPNATTSIFSSIIPQSSRSNAQQQQQQQTGPILRRYNHRRNSDFPCSSAHSSRSSEFLQVPMSSSQQRLTNHCQQSSSKLPRVRDIREASMDQIIFRVIEPLSTLSTEPKSTHMTEPIINISSFDDVVTSSIIRPNSLDIKESPPSPPPSPILRSAAVPTTSDATIGLREIKSYSRSKTAPLSSSTGAQQFLSVKRREARDLCGSSSNDESPSPTSGHHSTLV